MSIVDIELELELERASDRQPSASEDDRIEGSSVGALSDARLHTLISKAYQPVRQGKRAGKPSTTGRESWVNLGSIWPSMGRFALERVFS